VNVFVLIAYKTRPLQYFDTLNSERKLLAVSQKAYVPLLFSFISVLRRSDPICNEKASYKRLQVAEAEALLF